MATAGKLIDRVNRLKNELRDAAQSPKKEARVGELLHTLALVPMTLDVLQSTHIGKEVNSLRKTNRIVGEQAKQLVKQWKALLPDANPSISAPDTKDNYLSSSVSAHQKKPKKKLCPSHPKAGRNTSNHSASHLPSTSVRLCPESKHGAQPYRLSVASDISCSREQCSRPEQRVGSSISSARAHQTVLVESAHQDSDMPGVDVSTAKKRRGSAGSSMGMATLSKRSRTQVYSGRKTATGPQMVTSLFELSMKVLMDNIDAIEEVGGVPFFILKPLLERCSASQLMRLEEFNPHFTEDSDDLWCKHCHKEFKNVFLEEGQTWRELYFEKVEQREMRLKSLTATIKAKVKADKEPQRQAMLADPTRIASRRHRRSAPFTISRQGFSRSTPDKLAGSSLLKKKTMKMVKERKMMMNARPGRK